VLDLPVERVAGLETTVIDILDVVGGDYLLMRSDVEEDDVPLLMHANFTEPTIWRVWGWPEDDGVDAVVRLDGPEGDYFEIEMAYAQTRQVRLILPGQEHDTWEGADGIPLNGR